MRDVPPLPLPLDRSPWIWTEIAPDGHGFVAHRWAQREPVGWGTEEADAVNSLLDLEEVDP